MRRLRHLFWLLLLLPGLARAQETIELCPGQSATPTADGRLFGHIPYAEADEVALAPAPAGFAVDQACIVAADIVPDLTALIAAADAANPGTKLRGVSCFRSAEYQHGVFCGGIGTKRAPDAARRAESSAPPGHSEHATGYTIDFGTRPDGGCADVEPCFAATRVGQWLLLHAREYGFELSFPRGNAQGVTWEPWHWRWVGRSPDAPGAAAARALFDGARARFPADPGIGYVIHVSADAPPVALPALAREPRRQRRRRR